VESKKVVFALGAFDPEMRSIRYLLGKFGYRCTFANRLGRRCVTSNAYKADELSKAVHLDQKIVWVECRSSAFSLERDLIVDHHHPGDPGYSAPPSEFWEGSSIGQVAELVGASKSDFQLVAASDHCLSAAMRGECQGIAPRDLMSWRITTRAAMADIPPWMLRRRIDRAVERIQFLPRIQFGGQLIVDGSFDKTPELRDAAAVAGVPIFITKKNAGGQVKIGLYGACPEVVSFWIKTMQGSGCVERAYGNPFREYAGAILNLETSNRLTTERNRSGF
jgi:hypothetical protein